MNIHQFEVERVAILAVAEKLQADFMQDIKALRDWMQECKTMTWTAAEKPLFPKTPTKARRTRKRPRVATIVEDEEISDWTVQSKSPVKEVRPGRAASQQAMMKMKEVNLRHKLRRPSGVGQGAGNATLIEEAGPSKRQRRQQNSAASLASSPGASFTSARSTFSKPNVTAEATAMQDDSDDIAIVDQDALSPEEPEIVDIASARNTRSAAASRSQIIASAAKPSGKSLAKKRSKTAKKSSIVAKKLTKKYSVAIQDSDNEEMPLLEVQKSTRHTGKAVTLAKKLVKKSTVAIQDTDNEEMPLLEVQKSTHHTGKAVTLAKKLAKKSTVAIQDTDNEELPLLEVQKSTCDTSKVAALVSIPNEASKVDLPVLEQRKSTRHTGKVVALASIPIEDNKEDLPMLQLQKSMVHTDKAVKKSMLVMETATRLTITVTAHQEPPSAAVGDESMSRSMDDSLPLSALVNATAAKHGQLVPPHHASPVVKLVQLSPELVSKLLTPVSVKKRVAAYEKKMVKPVEVVAEAEGRVTRTKARAMASSSSNADRQEQGPSQKMDLALLHKLARKSLVKAINVSNKSRKVQEDDKENSFVGQSAKPFPVSLTAAKVKNTPFSNSKPSRSVLTSASANRVVVVNQSASKTAFLQKSSSNVLSGIETFLTKPKVVNTDEAEEKRREEQKRREEDAIRKKKEMMEKKIEAQRKRREERMLKVQASRVAQEREKEEQQARAEQEKEEKLRQAAEREERLREEAQRKKVQAQQRAMEIEERRRLEEAQRLARIREQEEEQKRLAAQRKKEADEADRQVLKRVQEEKEAMALAQMERERALRAAAEAKEKQKAAAEAKNKLQKKPASLLDSTFVVPTVDDVARRPPLRAATAEDYEMLDMSTADSDSEDEHRSTVPRWAESVMLKAQVKEMRYMPLKTLRCYFGSRPTTPNIAKVFNNPNLQHHKRTSSAIWKTMPRFSMMPSNH